MRVIITSIKYFNPSIRHVNEMNGFRPRLSVSNVILYLSPSLKGKITFHTVPIFIHLVPITAGWTEAVWIQTCPMLLEHMASAASFSYVYIMYIIFGHDS